MFRGWIWLTLTEGGRVWDPCEFPSPGAQVQLARKEELVVSDCVWTLCFGWTLEEVCGRSTARIERQCSTVLTTASILSLQVISVAETWRFTALIAAAGRNGITGRCRSSQPPHREDAVLWQGVPDLQERQPGVPCSAPEPLTWALLSSACLTSISPLQTPISVPDCLSLSAAPR